MDVAVNVILCLDQAVLQTLNRPLPLKHVHQVLLENLLPMTVAVYVKVDSLVHVALIDDTQLSGDLVADVVFEKDTSLVLA